MFEFTLFAGVLFIFLVASSADDSDEGGAKRVRQDEWVC